MVGFVGELVLKWFERKLDSLEGKLPPLLNIVTVDTKHRRKSGYEVCHCSTGVTCFLIESTESG